MYHRVRAYIEKYHMITQGDTILAGVSGGGDSVAMLSLLLEYQRELPFDLRVVHVNHGIRGAEADRDQKFVEKLCSGWGLPCETAVCSVPGLADQWGMGEEEAARRVRQETFSGIRKRLEAEGKRVRVALAHNRGDLAETVLHNLARGTGLRGIASMRPVSGNIIRPVLCLEREEIAKYLEQQGIPCVVDSTNLSDAYTRNRIRRHVLPLLEEEVNARARSHIADFALRMMEAEDYLAEQGKKLLNLFAEGTDAFLLGEDFRKEPRVLQEYAVREGMERLSGKRKDFTARHVEEVLGLWERQTGKVICLPYGLLAERTYEGVRLTARREPEPASQDGEWDLSVPGSLACPLGSFRTRIFFWQQEKIPEKTYTKWLDYDKIENKLSVRTRRTGDFLVVDDRGSRKKLSRVMIDDKLPAQQRGSTPLVVQGNEVLWMVGGRINEDFKITSETKRVLELDYEGGNDYE